MELNLKRFKVLVAIFMVLFILAAVIVPATSYFARRSSSQDITNLGFHYTLITNLGYKDTPLKGSELFGINSPGPHKSWLGYVHTQLSLPALLLEYVVLLILFSGLTFIIAVKKKTSC